MSKRKSGDIAIRIYVKTLFIAAAGTALCGAVGCGGSAQVSGKVMLKKSPVPNAEVEIAMAEDPDENRIRGITSSDGSLMLDTANRGSLPIGKCKITVSWWTFRNGKLIPAGEEGATLKGTAQTIERESVFEKTLVEGDNSFELRLDQVESIEKPSTQTVNPMGP